MSIPLFFIGFSSVWTLMLISLTGERFAVVLGAIALVIAGVRRDKTVMVTALSVFLACAIFCVKTELYYKPAAEYDGKILKISGQVIAYDKDRYILRVLDGPLKGYRIRLTSKYTECELNDFVSLKGKVYKLGTEESLNYYKSRDLYLGIYTYGAVDVIPQNKPNLTEKMRIKCYNIRIFLEDELNKNLGVECSSVLLGMLIGDKSKLSDEVYENFQKTGIVHLLAVSGFHTTLWSMIVYRFFLKRGLGMKTASLFAILFVLLFIGLTGFSKSTIRAGIMIIVFFFGRVVSRQPDSKNSLGLAAIFITFSNPFVGGDTGFLLSFFSTLGILVIFPSLQAWIRPYLKRIIHNFDIRQKVDDIVSVVLVTVSTLCFTLPFVMLFIGDISLVSPLTNLLTTLAASSAIFLSGVAVLSSKIPVLCAFEKPLLLAAGLLMKYILYVSEKLSTLSFASLSLENDFIFVAVSATLILIGSAIILNASKKRTVLLSFMFFVISIITHYLVLNVELFNYL